MTATPDATSTTLDTPLDLPQQAFMLAHRAQDFEKARQLWNEMPPQEQLKLFTEILSDGAQTPQDFWRQYELPMGWPLALLAEDQISGASLANDIEVWKEAQSIGQEAFLLGQLEYAHKRWATVGSMPSRIRDYLRDQLHQQPQVVKHWLDQHPEQVALLAGLSLWRPKDTWLIQSGIDLPYFLNRLLASHGLASAVAAGPGDAVQAWAHWLEAQPELLEAWDILREDDAALMEQHQDWIAAWLPDNIWSDSPLQVWLDGELVEEGRPMDHPPFPEDANGLEDDAQRALLHRFFKPGDYEGLDAKGVERQARRALQSLLQAQWPQDVWLRLCKRPPSLFIEALYRKKDWGWTGANAGQAAKELQATLQDPRLRGVLKRLGENAMARILEADPVAAHWVDDAGRHLLDHWLAALGNKARLRKHLVEQLPETHLRWMAEREDPLQGGKKTSKFDYMGWQATKLRLPTLSQQIKRAIGTKVSQKIREERRRKQNNRPIDRTPIFVEPEQDTRKSTPNLSNITVAVKKRRATVATESLSITPEAIKTARPMLKIRKTTSAAN